MTKLVVLDAYALIYRAYYAFLSRPMRNSKGVDTSAIYGFIKTLFEVQKKLHPTHFAVAFDVGGKTFRHELSDSYKANRQETPDVIKQSVPIIKNILKALNISIVELQGYEADDVVGTMVKYVETVGGISYMVTPDKDYVQLVSPSTFIYKPPRGSGDYEILGVKEVCEKYQIYYPFQIRDILALAGDASDNVQGVPNVGMKTATKLIREYGNIATIVENIDKLSPKQQVNFNENLDTLKLSEQLITIETNVPIPLDINHWRNATPNIPQVKLLFQEYEFRSLLSELSKYDTPVTQRSLFDAPIITQPQIVEPVEVVGMQVEYQELKSKEALQQWIIQNVTDTVGIYVDFTEDNKLRPVINGIGLLGKKGHAAWIVGKNVEANMLQPFDDLLKNDAVKKICNRLKLLYLYCKSMEIDLVGEIDDVALMYYVLEPEKRFDFQNLSITLLNTTFIPENLPKNYAACADIVYQLYPILKSQIEQNNLHELYYSIEKPLTAVLAEMEYEGIHVDKNVLQEAGKVLHQELLELEREIKILADDDTINIYSPKQLGELLFVKLQIDNKAKMTGKSKQFSTSEETLQNYIDKHPIIAKILEVRYLKKMLSTYIEALPILINPTTKHIHTTFNQTVVATGRLSSTNPNLQNIPIRDRRSQIIREAFIARQPHTDYVLLSADYSQIELRIMAHLSQDKTMIDAFNDNLDIHTATAAKIYHITPDKVTTEQRRQAKTANFGIIYGISTFGLAQRLNIPRTEAKKLIENYFLTFPDVQHYMHSIVEKAKQDGYVSTLYGRKRFLPEILSKNAAVRSFAERNAINAPIQGTAADIIKIAMINIQNKLKTLAMKSKMILQVHDELLFDVYRPELPEIEKLVKTEMEKVLKLSIPLIVEVGTGENWLLAH